MRTSIIINSTKRNERAFTLVEMIMVIVITGLVILFATARLDFLLPEYELRSTAREVGATLKVAKNKAAVSGKDVYIQYDLSEGTYHLLVVREEEPVAEEEATPADPTEKTASMDEQEKKPATYEETFHHELPEGVEFVNIIHGKALTTVSGKALVRMTPFGFAEHHIVNIRNAGGDVMAVKLNGFTGGLTFYDEMKEPDEILEDE